MVPGEARVKDYVSMSPHERITEFVGEATAIAASTTDGGSKAGLNVVYGYQRDPRDGWPRMILPYHERPAALLADLREAWKMTT